MKLRIAGLTVILAGACAASLPAAIEAVEKVPELAGRTAGKPQRCISIQQGALFRTSNADPHALLYDDGKTIWASNLQPNCAFEAGQTAIPDSSASYYCQGDFVRAGGRITLLPVGPTCVLGTFTPYRNLK